MIQQKRLYKSRTERMIDGVCGGIAQYFELDPTLVRIAWVLLTLLGGSGILLYIIAMIIMPKEPHVGSGTGSPEQPPPASATSSRNSFFWGILLIVIGLFLFFANMGWPLWRALWWMDTDMVLPLLLILVGVAFLWGGRNSLHAGANTAEHPGQPAERSPQPETTRPARLYRSATDRKLFGVCGGLAEYFAMDSTIVRLLVVLAALASFGIVLLGYILLAIVVPRQQPSVQAS